MVRSQDNRVVLINDPGYRNVAEHCRKFGINTVEKRKLSALLGTARRLIKSRLMPSFDGRNLVR